MLRRSEVAAAWGARKNAVASTSDCAGGGTQTDALGNEFDEVGFGARADDSSSLVADLTTGPAVLVTPGVLSMAADYAVFARALPEHFTVHIIERRGRGESDAQGDDYGIVIECEDVLALQKETGAALLIGHSYGGLGLI